MRHRDLMFRATWLVGAFLCLAIIAGCGGQRPRFHYAPDGTPIQIKRYPRWGETTQLPRIRTLAFKHNVRQSVKPQTPEQSDIISEHGQPDYLRIPYRSTIGDRVREWAYLEENRLFQFVNHELVYEGILSDKDRVLIQHGYPDRYLLQDDLLGNRRETFIYLTDLDTHQSYYSFNDDKLIFSKIAY